MNINVINNWYDVNVLRYQQLNEVINYESQTTLDKEVLLLECLSDLDQNEISKMKYSEFQNCLSELDFLNYPLEKEEIKKSFKIKDKTFKLNLKVENMTTEQYIDLMELTKGDILENLHNIVASVCITDEFETFSEKAEWIQDNMSIVTANSILVFFCKYSKDLMINSLKTQNTILKMTTKLTMNKKKKQQLKDFSKYLETYISLTE